MLDNFIEKIKNNDEYENREEQFNLIERISNNIKNSNNLIAEAPTGTGKSLSYLTAFLINKKENPKLKLIISTKTKNLQDQIFNKDIPETLKLFDMEGLKYYSFKGKSNYICDKGFKDFTDLISFEEKKMNEVIDWYNGNEFADKNDFDNKEILYGLDVERYDCYSNDECTKECKYSKLIKKIKKADIMVVNHNLLISNIIKNFKMEEYLLIIDEAHSFTEIAIREKTRNFNLKEMNNLFEKYYKHTRTMNKEFINVGKYGLDNYQDQNLIFNEAFGERLSQMKKDYKNLYEKKIGTYINDDRRTLENANYRSTKKNKTTNEKADKISDYIFQIPTLDNGADKENFVLTKINEIDNLKLILRPLNLDDEIKNSILNETKSTIFTSATISNTLNGFETFLNELKLDNDEKEKIEIFKTDEIFDYENQCQLILTKKYNSKDRNYNEDIANPIIDLIKRNSGNALILCTSHLQVEFFYKKISDKLNFNIFKQGEQTPNKLIQSFKNSDNNILIGTDSFWEGIDIKGDKLSLLIMVKLPFINFEDEFHKGMIQNLGKNSFFHYLMPKALLKFKQGFGRLIRSQDDRGIFFCPDNRILTTKWGEYFLKSLPEMKKNIDNVV